MVRASGTVRLNDRTSLAITIPGSIGLLATIKETGTAWLAGAPEPGKTVAIGFPGYPLLGVAALS